MSRKFKVGDRVKVVNDRARETMARVKDGDIGTIVSTKVGVAYVHCGVHFDNDPHFNESGPWSIPTPGLELIAETKGE